MSDRYTRSAKDRECQIRIPNQCMQDPETVVLCHIRMCGISGFGIKAPSQLATFGCFRCHQICDGQRNSEYTADERRMFLLEGMARTQAIWIKEGLMK